MKGLREILLRGKSKKYVLVSGTKGFYSIIIDVLVNIMKQIILSYPNILDNN